MYNEKRMIEVIRGDKRLEGKSETWQSIYNAYLYALINTGYNDICSLEECREEARDYANKFEANPVTLNR